MGRKSNLRLVEISPMTELQNIMEMATYGLQNAALMKECSNLIGLMALAPCQIGPYTDDLGPIEFERDHSTATEF